MLVARSASGGRSQLRSWPRVCSDDMHPRTMRWSYRLGEHVHDLSERTLVMGILNRTPDSFFDRGATFGLDQLLRRADEQVGQGADVLDVGGVKAGPGP